MKPTKFWLPMAALIALNSQLSQAHEAFFTHIDSRAIVSSALTFRSDDRTESNEAYLIPGALMGGEAFTYEQGLSIDQVKLSASYAWNEQFMLEGEIGSHQHGSDHDVEAESLAVVYRPWLDLDLYIAAGKMRSRITPSQAWHASDSAFTEASIQSDLHFGRHGNDQGIRFSYEPQDWQIGIEAWNGDSWPASDREGSFSAYVIHDSRLGITSVRTGGWASRANAKQRRDTRYGDGHSHSGNDLDVPSADFAFTGNIDAYGIYLATETDITHDFVWLFDAEYIHQEHEGALARENQQAQIRYSPESYRINTGFKYRHHTVKVQWEKAIVTNHVDNDVDSIFLSDSNLDGGDHEPTSMTVAWLWQLAPSFISKLEMVNEELVEPGDRRTRINLGIHISLDLLNQLVE